MSRLNAGVLPRVNRKTKLGSRELEVSQRFGETNLHGVRLGNAMSQSQATAASRIQPWLVAGRECRDRRLSTALENPRMRRVLLRNRLT